MAGPLDEVGDYAVDEQPPPPPPLPQPEEQFAPESVQRPMYRGFGDQGGDVVAPPPELDTSGYDQKQIANSEKIAQLEKTQQGVHPKYWVKNLQDQQRQLVLENRTLDLQRRADVNAARQAASTQRAAERQFQVGQRLRATDLAQRGIPTYRDANGVTPVTDETGAPMLHFDKSNNIAYDSTGNPKTLSYEGEAGPPKLRDPFEGLPLRTDPKTGDEYQVAKGLPWQWKGVDPQVRDQRMQEAKDKALSKEVSLVGRKLSIDHADLVTGTAEHKQMMKELVSSVPALQDPRLEGADKPTILKAIDDHFNTEYAQPQANETNGWFSKELSPAAQQLRDHIDSRKAEAMQTASDLFDLKDNLRGISERVAQGRDQERASIDTLIAHGHGEPGPLDQPPTPEGQPSSAPDTQQVQPDPLAEAKAGRKPYTIDDQNNIQFDPKNVSASAAQAAQDGLIDPDRYQQLKPQLDELQKASEEREKLLAAAGNNPKLKAILSGAIKGSAFAAGFPAGAGAGALAGAAIPGLGETGIGEAAGAIIGGLITGTVASKGAEGIIRKVGEYNDTIHSLSAASELHPNYDLAGNLISFGAGAFTKGAAKLVGAGAEALTAKAAAAAPEAIAPTVQKYGNAIARSYYGSGGGLVNTVKNLKEDASIRAAQLGDQAGAGAQIAKAIAYRVGGAAAANVAIDTIINTGMHAAGLQPEGETWQSAGAAALLGAFTSGHGIEFEGYNKTQVADILMRGKVRMDNGLGLADPLPANVAAKVAKTAGEDIHGAQRFGVPLTAKEQEVWEAFGRKALDLQKSGQIPLDMDAINVTARQALQGGQPYGVTAVDIQPGEAPPAPPPAPGAPKIGAPPVVAPPTEGVPPSETAPTTEGPIQQAPPTSEPARPPSTTGVAQPPDAGAGAGTPAPIPPASNVPGPATGAGGGAVTGGTTEPPTVGPPQVPAPTAQPGQETAQPPAVPGTVEPKVEFPPIEQPGPLVTPPAAAPPVAQPHVETPPAPVTPPSEAPPATEAPVHTPETVTALKGMGYTEKGISLMTPERAQSLATNGVGVFQKAVAKLGVPLDVQEAMYQLTPAEAQAKYGASMTDLIHAATTGPESQRRLPEGFKIPEEAPPAEAPKVEAPPAKAEAPKEEAPAAATPQELYQKQTDAFNAYKELAHLKSTDPKRVAAWDAYQAAKAEFQKATEKPVAPTKEKKPVTPQVPPIPGMGPIGATPPAAPAKVTYKVVGATDGYEVHDSTGKKHGYFSSKERALAKVTELEKLAGAPKEEQPPPSGSLEETHPPTETPPATGEGESGVGPPDKSGKSRHIAAEQAVRGFHEAVPRGIRVSHLSGQSVPLVRVHPSTLKGGGIATSLDPETGQIQLWHAPEIVAQSLDEQTANGVEDGKTLEEARAAALDFFERGMAGEHAHAREMIVSGAVQLAEHRERVWKEMHPKARQLMPDVYVIDTSAMGVAANPAAANLIREAYKRVWAAEYVRMKFQLAHGIMPEEADIHPEKFAELLPYLREKESPWIESHLRAMDDLTKQDTELPFQNDDLNELYNFHEKKGLSDAQAQAAVIADALEGYDDIQEALDAADAAPEDHVHTTESDHEISNEAFREAAERAKAAEDDPKPLVMPPEPEVLSKVPRRPPTVPESIGGPGAISDVDISQAEVVPMFEGSGDEGRDFIQMPDGSRIGVTFKLTDVRLHPDNPDNEQPDASAKETQDWLVSKSGKNYDDRQPFARDPTFLTGPTVAVFVEGRLKTISGHRRKYLRLINREKYEAALPKNLKKFGIEPDFAQTMIDKGGWPYLSAVVDDVLTPEQESALGRYLNTTKEQPKLPVFEAISAGRQLTPETLDTAGHLFEQNFEAPPLKMLKSAAARDLVAAMFKDGALRESDKGKYIADNGAFTEEGAKFARLVLVGHIVDDTQLLDSIQNTGAMTKLINGLSQLMIMKRRGQDMDKITQMLRMENERSEAGLTMLQYQQLLDQNMFDRRYADVEAIHDWFNSFAAPQAKQAFLKALNDYLPLEKGAEDMMAKNVDLGEGLLRDKNLDTLSMMQSGKSGGMTPEERILKALKDKEAKGVKLTPAEHDLVLKIEKKLGQKLLIDPNKTPRNVQEPDIFPEETKPIEPKRAVLGGQSELDILAPGIDKSGQQTLFMQKPKLLAIPQPPTRLPYEMGGTIEEQIARTNEYDQKLSEWVKQIPEKTPIVFSKTGKTDDVAVVTPVVPRAAAEPGEGGVLARPTKPGEWRVSTFYKPMIPQLTEGMVMKMVPGDWTPTSHEEYGSREKAVSSALHIYPKYSPEVLFMQKPTLPGFENLPEIQWKENKDDGIWDGVATKTGVAYMITELAPGQFQIHYFNPDGGGASDVGFEPDLATAKKAAETHYAMWKADNRNRPARSESVKLVGPREKENKDQGELRLFGDPKKRIPQNKPVSLQISRGGMTQTSPVNFLPARFLKIAKPHQQQGANLALWAFDGGTGFLNNDGAGAGKTLQQLMVAHIMANTKAEVPFRDEHGQTIFPYDKQHGISPRRRPMPEGMTHATLIVTENERIIQNAFAKDAEMLGIDAWRYMGDDPKPDRVYLGTYNDLRSGRVRPGQFRTVIFDEAQGLRNAGYETAQALAGTKISGMAQHVMYATATPFDKPEQIVYLEPLLGAGAIQDVFGSLGISIRRGAIDPKTGKADIRFSYPDSITAEDIEKVKEAIFNELTRQGKMISRNVPLKNVKVNFVEVPISDAVFLRADAMYQRIHGAVSMRSAQNAGGVAGMAVRGYLETQKVDAAMKLVRESLKEGRQVVIFASRIKQGTEGSYHAGIEGTLDKLFGMLEKEFGKGTTGRVYGGDNKRSVDSIDRFQRSEFRVLLGTPNSAGTGINLDDIHGDTPRDMIIITAPLSAIEAIQDIGRINRLTTLSTGDVKFLFVEHPVDTWNLDILADKLVTLSATVAGDLKGLKPLEQRTAEMKLNDDAVALMTVFQREPQFQKIIRQMTTGQPGFISEQEARERLNSPNKAVKEDAQGKVDKFLKDIQDETDRQRNNANQMSEDEIMELVDDEDKFKALSPGHAYFQEELAKFVKANTLYPTHAEMLRALGAQMKGDFLQRIDFSIRKMKPLGRGGGTFGGRGTLILQEKGKKAKINPYLSNDMGKVTLHEYGHVGYFVLLSVAERRFVARLYAKLGGRSGTQAYFVKGTPQAATSKSRYYSKNVYEFFAESFAQYVLEKRVPGEIMTRFHERILKQFKKNFEMLRRRKDITREPGLISIYEKILDLKKNAKDIDYSYPDRASLLLSTVPPKGLSRGETERWLAHKASIYNSLATNQPPSTMKIVGTPEKVTARARYLPPGTEAITPSSSALALRGQELPKSLSGPPAITRPVATETLLGGVKNHFYIVSTKGGHTVFMRTLPKGVAPEYIEHQPLHARSQTLPTFRDAVDVVKKTLAAGEKMGARHVWHQSALDAEISQMQKPRGKKNAGEITSAEGVGFRGEGGEVGAGASLRQPGEIARQSETQKGQGEVAAGRGGSVPLRINPEFKQPEPVSDEKLAAALTSNKAPLVGANRTLPKGTPVSVRIDIPSFLRSGTYAQTVHAPKLGKNIGYDSIVRLDGPVSFTVREGTSAKIRDQLISKAPIAAAEGKYNPDRALPADINDLSKWTPLGFDPLEHSYFYDKTNDEPVVRADEAISVGNTVYVRNPVHGSRAEFLYMQKPRPRDPNDPGQSGVPDEFTLSMLSPAQRKKIGGVFATVKKGSGFDWAKAALSDIRGLAPTSKSPKHLAAAQDAGRFLGERNRQAEIARRQIKPSWQMFVKMGADREDLPYENHPGTEFAHAMSAGKAPRGGVSIPTMITNKMEADLKARGHTQEEINKMKPQEAEEILRPAGLDDAKKLYRELLDDRIKEAERADAPLSEKKEHYFPGYWTEQSRTAFGQALDEILTDKEKETFDANNTSEAKMAEIRARVKELIKENADKGSSTDWMHYFARRPLKGPEKFRHEMVFSDKLTAEKFGLEPTMPNPADAVMAKLHELDQSIMANKLIQKWTGEGNMKVIPPTARPPEGWREFPDPFGKVWAKSGEYGLNLVGKRIVPNEYADIIENYLSDSLYDSPYLSKPFTLWMAFSNMLNQTQLGVGSAFHAGFTSMEAQISSLARLMQDMYGVMRGNRSTADLGNALKAVPTAMWSVPKQGDAVFNAYINKQPSQDPRINKIVRAAELAGAGISIEKGLRTEQSTEMYRDYYSGRKIRAAMRSPVALIELMAKPIMDMLVPRQKLGIFADEAWRLIEQNPDKTLEELTPEFRFLWSTIDARMGQVQYKRLFINNVAKNVGQMFIRAPGWTGGTILQLGGAIKDAGKFFKEWHETGSLPKDLPPRTAYAISLVLLTATMNAVLTYLFTGKKPEGQDYWAFRTGREDEHGNPERFVLPTYMKDLYAYGKHPGETILNKTHPAISLFSEIIKNKDYYGVEVHDEDANAVKQAYQVGAHIISAFQPFWWRGAVRAGQRGKGLPEKVLPLVGVMPAPRALTQTPAQAELDKYYKTHQPESGISPAQFEVQQGKRQLVAQLRRGESPDITKAVNKGVIAPRDISQLYKRARLGPIGSAIDRLPLVEAEKVYALANAKEREQMSSILERKRAGSLRRGGRTMFTGF